MRRLTESEFTDFMRMYTDDAHGNRVLVGLTIQETEEFEAIQVRMRADRDATSSYQSMAERSSDLDRSVNLHNKHEIARIQTISAEVEARHDPVRH